MPADLNRRNVRDAAGGIAVLALANFVAITTEVLPVGLLPQIAAGVRVTESTAGLLVTVYAFAVAALALPLTAATRRFARKPLLLVTLVTYVLSNALVAVAPTFATVAAARTLGGIGHAVFFSVSIAYASRLVGPLHTGRALTLVTAGGTLGFVLGVPLGTTLGEAVGWRWSFALLAAVCALTALMVAAALPGVAAPRADAAARRGGAPAARRRLAVVVATNTALFCGHYTVYTYISPLLGQAGAAPARIGPMLLLFGAVGLVGLWAASRYLDRRPRALTIGATAVIAAALVALALALPSLVPVVLCAVLWLAAFGAVPATFQAAALRVEGTDPDLAGASVNATANLGIGLGAALGSAVLATAGSVTLALTGAVLVGAALVTVLIAREAFPRAV